MMMNKKPWYKEDKVIIFALTLAMLAFVFTLIFFQECVWVK